MMKVHEELVRKLKGSSCLHLYDDLSFPHFHDDLQERIAPMQVLAVACELRLPAWISTFSKSVELGISAHTETGSQIIVYDRYNGILHNTGDSPIEPNTFLDVLYVCSRSKNKNRVAIITFDFNYLPKYDYTSLYNPNVRNIDKNFMTKGKTYFMPKNISIAGSVKCTDQFQFSLNKVDTGRYISNMRYFAREFKKAYGTYPKFIFAELRQIGIDSIEKLMR